jgi:hypothetical protein
MSSWRYLSPPDRFFHELIAGPDFVKTLFSLGKYPITEKLGAPDALDIGGARLPHFVLFT